MKDEVITPDSHPERDRWVKNGHRLLIVMMVYLAVLSIIYCFYATPSGDDFDRISQARDVGLIEALKERRAEWTGRWTGLGLVMLIGTQVELFMAYPAILLAFYLGTFGAVHLAVCAITALPVRSNRALFYSAIVFFIYWMTIPAPGETFYWFTGAANEHLAFILGAIVFYLARHAEGGRFMWAWGGGAAAILALSGVHELYSLMTGYLLLLGLIVSWSRGGKTRWYFLTMGLLLLAGLVFVATAPGNQLRAEAYSAREAGQVGLGGVFAFSSLHFLQNITQWAASPALLMFSVWLLFQRNDDRLAPSWLLNMKPGARLAICLAGLSGLFLGFFGFSVVGGVTAYYERMLNFFCMWFVLLWILAILSFARSIHIASTSRAYFVVSLFLMLSFFGGNTSVAARQLIDGTVRQYSMFIRYLDAELKEANSEVYISGIPFAPEMYYPFKLTADPEHWFNKSLARYYNLPEVVLGRRPGTE